MKLTKNQWIVIAVVGLIIVWYFFLRKKKGGEDESSYSNEYNAALRKCVNGGGSWSTNGIPHCSPSALISTPDDCFQNGGVWHSLVPHCRASTRIQTKNVQ